MPPGSLGSANAAGDDRMTTAALALSLALLSLGDLPPVAYAAADGPTAAPPVAYARDDDRRAATGEPRVASVASVATVATAPVPVAPAAPTAWTRVDSRGGTWSHADRGYLDAHVDAVERGYAGQHGAPAYGSACVGGQCGGARYAPQARRSGFRIFGRR